jgi:hypothetical protein
MTLIYSTNKTISQLFNGCQKITNAQKTEDCTTQTPLKLQTDMISDALYESAVQTSLIPLHGRRSRGQLRCETIALMVLGQFPGVRKYQKTGQGP